MVTFLAKYLNGGCSARIVQFAMILRKISYFVVTHGHRLVAGVGTLLLLHIALLWYGLSHTGSSFPFGSAIEKSLGCLMTLESPSGIPDGLVSLRIARIIGWFVSFAGWLMVPVAIGSAVSFMQSERMSAKSIVAIAHRSALERGVRSEVASRFSDVLSELLAEIPDESEIENSDGANRGRDARV